MSDVLWSVVSLLLAGLVWWLKHRGGVYAKALQTVTDAIERAGVSGISDVPLIKKSISVNSAIKGIDVQVTIDRFAKMSEGAVTNELDNKHIKSAVSGLDGEKK